ncbi:hypothetical protein KKE60_05215, partial [Patescibacteria group bacterium]|nr:hypothetical protein [Patescibacteria group bacterium]
DGLLWSKWWLSAEDGCPCGYAQDDDDEVTAWDEQCDKQGSCPSCGRPLGVNDLGDISMCLTNAEVATRCENELKQARLTLEHVQAIAATEEATDEAQA